MMKTLGSIIIPTFNNPQYLTPCIDSIRATGILNGLFELLIVNNGQQPISDYVKDWPNTKVLEPKENLGWEKGLQYGINQSQAPFVVFQNDDTQIPAANADFYYKMLSLFSDENIAAVGPATTVAAGWHSIFRRFPLPWPTEVSYLIFFTVMMRRDYLEQAGGIDTSCPGGDDFDLSIRLRKLGKKLIVHPGAFLIHHAFKTGERIHGTSNAVGGWNSKEMSDRTNKWLIQKHGFKTFMETIRGLDPAGSTAKDTEGDIIRGLVNGNDVLELGCGPKKTVSTSVGVDRVPQGEMIPHVGALSVADIVADVSEPMPIESGSYDVIICRHILEHCVDTVKTLNEWKRILRHGGQLIIAVPNENIRRGIPLNPEHCHAFSPESLAALMELCGFKAVTWADPKNGVSFIGVYEKVPVMEAVSA